MALTCGEEILKKAIADRFGRTLTIGRAAVLTRALNGRPACHYCGPCGRGCRTGSYYSSPHSSLPAAAETGRLTLIPDAVVSHVTTDEEGQCSGVYYVDRLTRNHREVAGRIVVLCASTLESTRIMLNSTSGRHPNGIANSSGVLGHYLMDHVMGGGASGTLPVLKGVPDTRGNRPNGIYIPRFRNLDTRESGFLRGFGFQGRANLSKWGHANSISGFGAEFKRRVKDERPWQIGLGGFGECLPRFENHCRLDTGRVDAWGIPILHISAAYGDNERRMVADMADTAMEMLGGGRGGGHLPPGADLAAGAGHSRGGHGAHGQRSGHVGAQPLAAGARREQPVRDGRLVLRLVGLPEPDAHDDGAGRPRL